MPKVADAMGISLTRLIHAVSREPALQLARAAGAERAADQLAELADEPCADMIDVAHRKLRVDTRRWLLAKRHPSQFGEQRFPQADTNVAVTVITGVPAPQTLAAPSVPQHPRITVEETARAIPADATGQLPPTPQTPQRD